MYLRVLLLIGILATRVFVPFALMILPALVVAWGAGFWLYRKAPKCRCAEPARQSDRDRAGARLRRFSSPFAAVAAKWAAGRFGEQGSPCCC